MPALRTCLSLLLIFLCIPVSAEPDTPVKVTNLEDSLPEPKRIESFFDTRGMSQRNFRRALKSWEGADARLFERAWGSVFETKPPEQESGERMYRLDDQDLARVRRYFLTLPCGTGSCSYWQDIPLVFKDDDVRRIRSCTAAVTVVDGVIERIRLDNDGCRYNAEERHQRTYDPERVEKRDYFWL